jgi:hypothetical protein
MKEAVRVGLDGLYIEPVIVPMSQSGVQPIYSTPEPQEEDVEPLEPEVIGFIIAVPTVPGLYMPRFDFDAWETHNQPQEFERDNDGELVLDDNEQPIPITRPEVQLWVEGLTPEEIDEIRNAPQPETAEQKVARLESESVDTMLAVAEVYETATVANVIREQEAVYTMLGLAEAYENIIIQQATIDGLTARITALESSGGGE